MTLLTMFYKLLYKKDSFEKGTLNGEKIRLSRTEANGDDVKNHFDDCKELAVSLIDSYIVSAALEYFGMDKLDSVPTKNFILSSDESSEYEKKMSLVHSLEKHNKRFKSFTSGTNIATTVYLNTSINAKRKSTEYSGAPFNNV